MSYRTYYLRRDGSASPNRPWSEDHIMTVRAHSIREAEALMPYLAPSEIYARIGPEGSGSSIVLCSLSALKAHGMNTRLFINKERWGIHETEVIGTDLDKLVPELRRVLTGCQRRRDRRYRVEFFDGTAYTPYRWDEKLDQMTGHERHPVCPDRVHLRAMDKAFLEMKPLIGKQDNVEVIRPIPWNL